VEWDREDEGEDGEETVWGRLSLGRLAAGGGHGSGYRD